VARGIAPLYEIILRGDLFLRTNQVEWPTHTRYTEGINR